MTVSLHIMLYRGYNNIYLYIYILPQGGHISRYNVYRNIIILCIPTPPTRIIIILPTYLLTYLLTYVLNLERLL